MEQLLKITSVPIKYELKINSARLEYQNSKAELEISRHDGSFSMKSRSAKLNIDTFDARNSVSPTLATLVKQTATKGINAASDAAAQFAQEGKLMLRTDIGDNVLNQIFAQRTEAPTGEFELGFLPSAPVKFEYQPGDLTINYEMDKLNFDLKVANGNFEFIPGNIEVSITQHPDVIIDYIGGPLYVPPSADPDHQPIDVKA
ncbi:MAG: hypothetical protein KHZ72_11180 [Lachnospiraceae bacterium]|nr:hypothetical protein [Lachnospiraceae bacterium]